MMYGKRCILFFRRRFTIFDIILKIITRTKYCALNGHETRSKIFVSLQIERKNIYILNSTRTPRLKLLLFRRIYEVILPVKFFSSKLERVHYASFKKKNLSVFGLRGRYIDAIMIKLAERKRTLNV